MAEFQTVNPYIQKLKHKLVKLGPHNVLVQRVLWAHGKLRGFDVTFTDSQIRIRSSDRLMILDISEYIQVPIMIAVFDLNFRTVQAKKEGNLHVLDFSKPGFHTYLRNGVGFYFPRVAEDDSIDVYLEEYTPKEGDIIWDVGAHAGATSYFLAKLVGPSGKVYAFEPDESNYEYLIRNLALHSVSNVIPVKKALSGRTGYAEFAMDGTMSAGIRDTLVYSNGARLKKVETISIADACQEFGSIPALIKMDIEGAEVEALTGSAEFLKQHPVHFAIESHRVGNEYTHVALERFLSQIGYNTRSAVVSGQVFMWGSGQASRAAYAASGS